jgi:flavin reductase (DIM6/NTAB) family NADH-FMN oxidoreductase RutF
MKDVDPQRQQLAAALGRVPSGLFILTARQGEAETGMLASWVQQCSLDPPQVSVAIKRDRPVAAWLVAGSTFVLNILDDSETDMLVHFGRGFALDQPAFEGLDIEREEGSAPILSDALAYLHCRVVARHSAGDHDLFVAQVIAGRMLGEGQPMVHVRKSGFHY